MRLINVQTLSIDEFIDEAKIPPYVALSHRWGSEELGFEEVSQNRIDESKSGWTKLISASQVAVSCGVNHIWIDTCCIDKKSSAELSEAINSMFTWYKNSKLCVVYLEDVNSGADFRQSFLQSVWFTRSWTLQELLAPTRVEFYDGDWKYVGDKASNLEDIHSATGIPRIVLQGYCGIWECSIAQKISWAANRRATRPEDIAYSLLGIFDVNMPLLYGEGDKAFARLQEEIIRHSTDPTFLLWGYQDLENENGSLLAKSPADFAGASMEHIGPTEIITPFNLINIGLEIEATLIRWQPEIYGLVVAQGSSCTYVLLLKNYPWLKGRMYRIGFGEIYMTPLPWTRTRTVTILRGSQEQRFGDRVYRDLRRGAERFGFNILCQPSLRISPLRIVIGEKLPTREIPWTVTRNATSLSWIFDTSVEPGIAKFCCAIGGARILVDLSFDFDSRPCALIYKHNETRSVWQISDNITENNRTVTGGDQREHLMIKIPDEDNDAHVSYFIRPPFYNEVFAKLPEELTSTEFSIWVSLIPPRVRNTSQYWTFEISCAKPAPKFDKTITFQTTTRYHGGQLGGRYCWHVCPTLRRYASSKKLVQERQNLVINGLVRSRPLVYLQI